MCLRINKKLGNTLIPHALSDFNENVMNTLENKFIRKKNIEMKILSEFKLLFNNTSQLSIK